MILKGLPTTFVTGFAGMSEVGHSAGLNETWASSFQGFPPDGRITSGT